jgi:ribonuclease P protein component
VKKAYRIKKNSEIESLMKQRQSVGDGFFALYHIRNSQHEHFRYAISVPKKFGSAIARNQAKRRIREIVRKLTLPNNVDFFVVIKPKANTLNFWEMKEILYKLFARAKIIEG